MSSYRVWEPLPRARKILSSNLQSSLVSNFAANSQIICASSDASTAAAAASNSTHTTTLSYPDYSGGHPPLRGSPGEQNVLDLLVQKYLLTSTKARILTAAWQTTRTAIRATSTARTPASAQATRAALLTATACILVPVAWQLTLTAPPPSLPSTPVCSGKTPMALTTRRPTSSGSAAIRGAAALLLNLLALLIPKYKY